MSLPEAIGTVLEYVQEWEGGWASCPSCSAMATSSETCSDDRPNGHFQTCELRGAMDLLEEVGPGLTEDLLAVADAVNEVPKEQLADIAAHLEDATSPGYWSESQEKALHAVTQFIRGRANS